MWSNEGLIAIKVVAPLAAEPAAIAAVLVRCTYFGEEFALDDAVCWFPRLFA
jgi:hypothetical protein